jgi:hypothetical protein
MLQAPASKNSGLGEKAERSSSWESGSPFDPLDDEDVCHLRWAAGQTAGRPSARKCLTVLRAIQLILVF